VRLEKLAVEQAEKEKADEAGEEVAAADGGDGAGDA